MWWQRRYNSGSNKKLRFEATVLVVVQVVVAKVVAAVLQGNSSGESTALSYLPTKPFSKRFILTVY